MKMAAVEVIEDVARSAAMPISAEDINEETKKLAEDIKEKANACFKSSDSWLFVIYSAVVRIRCLTETSFGFVNVPSTWTDS